MKTPARNIEWIEENLRRQNILLLGVIMALAFATLGVLPACAQQQASLPAQEGGAAKPSRISFGDENPKNDRIFEFIPNYTTVENPTTFAPITVGEKFKLGAEDSFDPYEVPLAGIVAAMAQASNDDPSWGQGMNGYSKSYAAAFADTMIGSFMTTGVFPSMLKEDPRYFRKGDGPFSRRGVYALKRIFIIRTDSDHSQFNLSEFGGNAVAAAISLTYHSPEERTFSNFGSNYATQIAIDVVANQMKEFWPDIRRRLFKSKPRLEIESVEQQ